MTDYKLVPVEPTPEMVDAARDHHEGEAYLPVSLYKAMITAAPSVPVDPVAWKEPAANWLREKAADHTDNEGEPLDEAVRKSWSRYCNAFAKSPDAPYPGMIESFERHYSQDFRDPEWRSEAGTWAAAWKSAIATTSNPDETCPHCGHHPGDLTTAWLDGAHCSGQKLSDPAAQKRLAAQWGYVLPDDLEAMRRDATRYRWLRDGGNDDMGVVRGFDFTFVGATAIVGTYEEDLEGEQLDEAIDHARRVEGGGE